ncbi:MAG: UDP-N-acetylenolpyruvoylglucosamine reductase [Haliea sp.]|uniref:UDP-N-acetylmuramate dehydrogenase n=1 Tax=Haliea sp. TaxID=1932666 RepID=UPI000C528094|nr:UDP-N-acetylmuramate dehydrogenase [Haliea sp.]MBM68471.1 UDP-N-acetylenolpyruvoylglucosamine reductase [Haliea sp.]|tara:strand:- start:2569 stop:3597 length:1029 start_codon:yes stop_codon:yes gene_type:complete
MDDALDSLQPPNTLRLRAQAQALRSVYSVAEVESVLAWARARALPVLPLGEGSNVVLQPQLDALALLVRLSGRELLEDGREFITLRVGAGENWHALVVWTLSRGYYGLENLALIPGTVGAAPIQNIGAYGREVATFVVAVHARRVSDGTPLTLSAAECEFAYRDSVFKRALVDSVVITHVDLRLARRPATNTDYPALSAALGARGCGDNASPQEVFDAVVALRRARLPDPALQPNVGSFFKNPIVSRDHADALRGRYPDLPVFPLDARHCKLAAAWLIEQAGWKGRRSGGVGVHPGHALVLVNYGANTAPPLLALAAEIQATVAQQFAVHLELEPRVYGVER